MVKTLLKSAAAKIEVPLSEGEISSFCTFYEELIKWGQKINLTALLKDKQRLVEELFVDSLVPLKTIREAGEEETSLLDIGSGGGIPGIPIKIAAPGLDVTLADAVSKKVFFHRHAIRALNLSRIESVHTRLTEAGSPDLEKECFDWAVSKAVSDLKTLGMWARPHLKKRGRLICMKGKGETIISLNGFSAPEIIDYKLPMSGIERRLIVYRKL